MGRWGKGTDGDPIDDRNVATIGYYVVDHAYGGVELQRIMNEGGGVDDVLRSGHTTKRSLYDQMHAFLTGIEVAETREVAS
jgi:hypothetical protein